MTNTLVKGSAVLAAAVVAIVLLVSRGGQAADATVVRLPGAAYDIPAPPNGELRTAVLAGGCFWGIEAVFEHVKGVTKVVSGYAGGTKETASYDKVSSGKTGHAEAVQITYDPAQVSYGTLLKVFFSVAHDPTQLNRQGPDVGPQYRSAIFYGSDEEKRAAEAYIAQLEQAKAFPRPIVTDVAPLDEFYAAEDYHQDYAVRNPTQPYIVIHDLPKVERLKAEHPELWREERVS
ncbi:MAG TPA: peptide-methionine (S)-S-oxide reductase MsrA [Gemmatimonadaceae bacterium]|nr:peptide-methionine (S)-S-oxide reductase MsrA [Gemmatimonadaceae bacterium]